MDLKRKKEILEEWKNRRPEMGVVSITCKAAGTVFAATATDTQLVFNRHRFQLSAGIHPNTELQKLWAEYGEAGMEFAVVRVLERKDSEENPAEKLEELFEEYLAETPRARKLTR